MANAKPSKEYVLGIIISYILFVLGIAFVISFIVGLIKSISCTTGPRNSYEHFQDVNTINNHLFESLNNMNGALESTMAKIQDAMTNTGDMRGQTCSIYNNVKDKYVKSKAAEVADESEYSMSKEEQKKFQQNRAKNAVQSWANQVAQFQQLHKEGAMLDCDSSTTEGFQDMSVRLAPLAKTLQAKLAVFSNIITAPSFGAWLGECKAVKGTADYLKVYINNTQVTAEISKCKNDFIKKIDGYSSMDPDKQKTYNDAADKECNIIYGGQYESFQDVPYVNTQFSFPVPFPTSSMTPEQIGYYTTLSQGHDLIQTYVNMVGTTYQDAVGAYNIMNQTNQTYVDYSNKVNQTQNSNYTAAQANSLSS